MGRRVWLGWRLYPDDRVAKGSDSPPGNRPPDPASGMTPQAHRGGVHCVCDVWRHLNGRIRKGLLACPCPRERGSARRRTSRGRSHPRAAVSNIDDLKKPSGALHADALASSGRPTGGWTPRGSRVEWAQRAAVGVGIVFGSRDSNVPCYQWKKAAGAGFGHFRKNRPFRWGPFRRDGGWEGSVGCGQARGRPRGRPSGGWWGGR